ncbi:hypothetical protein [Moorena sp. SIO4G3]|nr:hypothetical protein [Moorena sp. SIO4G3]
MTSNHRTNHPMPKSSSDRYPSSTSANKSNTYCPSVPISVYRELAAELQATQAMLDSLHSQNQHLVKQHQQLRQEVKKVINSALHLQQVINSLEPVSPAEVHRPQQVKPPEPRQAPPIPSQRTGKTIPGGEFSPPQRKPQTPPSSYRETLVIEQQDNRSLRSSQPEAVSYVNGWVLVIAILGIVLSAFGAGFLVVKPILDSNR